MCGRYTARKLRWPDYAAEPHFEEFSEKRIVPRFNIAPSQAVPIIRLDKTARRVGDLVRWGLIPHWTQGKPKQQPINARAESVATSGMFRDAFERHRCLQAADGFYEWKRDLPLKRAFYIRRADDEPFAFAGLWQRWRPDAHAEPIDTCCHITLPSNRLMSLIHDRMPAILLPRDYAAWLNPSTDAQTLLSLLKPLPDDLLTACPVSNVVNKPVNDSAENITPIGECFGGF